MSANSIDFTLEGNYAPIAGEIDAPVLKVVEGALPKDLCGTLYRNGPNPMFPPLSAENHWFLGEGMVHAITLEDGRPSYRNRWVRTSQYGVQRRLGRRVTPTVFGGYLSGGDSPPPRPNPANTNIIWHGGKLLALDEGNLPIALDPDSLDTFGAHDFSGAYAGPFTAHPKIDPRTGELFVFGYMARGPGSPEISLTVISANGEVTRREMFRAPFTSMVHDFIVTAEHIIVPICPATIDVQRRLAGGPLIAWDPDKGTHVGVMSRSGGVSTLRWFEAAPCYVFHAMNAYTVDESVNERRGARIIADVMTYPRVALFPTVSGEMPSRFGPATLTRWTIDLAGDTNAFKQEVLSDLQGEFPRLDERFAGLEYRHGYYAGQRRTPAPGASYDSLVHVDLASGAIRRWDVGAGRSACEPVFVPRAAQAQEGAGWLVTLVYDAERNLSDLVVLDAADIAAGPLARVELPTRVPFGFHGNWRPLPS